MIPRTYEERRLEKTKALENQVGGCGYAGFISKGSTWRFIWSGVNGLRM